MVLGDVIVGIDDKPVKKVNDLFQILNTHRVGETVTVHFVRQGQRISKEIALREVQ